MIYEALSCIVDEMNDYFKVKLKINEEKIIISGLVSQDGTVAIQGENKIIITLVNIEKEPVLNNSSAAGGGKVFSSASNPANINIYILISAYFTAPNYPEALRFLSFIISFLQEKSVFTKSNTGRLPDNINKLTLEMESLGFEKLNNIWATLGAKYMPSLVYKVRMLTFDSSLIKEYRPLISKM